MKRILSATFALLFCVISYSQNVGIGTTTPTKGKLVVRGTEGAVSAMFGDTTTGVAIENNYPGIGLNSYYTNNNRRPISTGYGAVINLNPNNGDLHIYTSPSAMNEGNVLPMSLRMIIKASGNTGINTPDPQSTLEVTGLTTLNPNPFSQTAAVVTGRMKFSGAAFVVTANAANLTSVFNGSDYHDGYAIIIDNPICNNNPNVMVMVTSKGSSTPYSVAYDNNRNKWVIRTTFTDRRLHGLDASTFQQDCNNNCVPTLNPIFVPFAFFAAIDAFNVLVIEY